MEIKSCLKTRLSNNTSIISWFEKIQYSKETPIQHEILRGYRHVYDVHQRVKEFMMCLFFSRPTASCQKEMLDLCAGKHLRCVKSPVISVSSCRQSLCIPLLSFVLPLWCVCVCACMHLLPCEKFMVNIVQKSVKTLTITQLMMK